MDHRKEYEKWLDSPCVDQATKDELTAISNDDKEISERFSSPLAFGTAGLRGTMKAGLSNMNLYTVRYAVQGLADLIKGCGEDVGSGVVIAHDSRNNSRLYAEGAAEVLAANGIHVNLFDDLRPTPELSFAIRHLGCIAGINITASHNPAEYNGCKVYWSDGAQMPPEHADEVAASMTRNDIFDDVKVMPLSQAMAEGLVDLVGEEVDKVYLEKVLEQSLGQKFVSSAEDLKVVYTPFHGTGYKMVPEILSRIGAKDIYTVDSQMTPDGDFPTVKSPNPETLEAFAEAVKVAEREDADLIIGTDPDGDRCGVAIKAADGYRCLTGNQIGVLLMDYVLKIKSNRGLLPDNSAAITSIVSTPMVDPVCDAYGVEMIRVLTGFKFIGEKIKLWEEDHAHTFVFGFEESNGYLSGTYARDKDAVLGAMLVYEAACFHKVHGRTMEQAMDSLYRKYGYHEEKVISITMEGSDGKEKMNSKLASLRSGIPEEIGLGVTEVRDYKTGSVTDPSGNVTGDTGLPKSDVLFYCLEDGCSVVVRPSGTEPKVKIYLMSRGVDPTQCSNRLSTMEAAAMELMKM